MVTDGPRGADTPPALERTSENLVVSFDYAPERMAIPSGAFLFIQSEQTNNQDYQDTGHNCDQDVREVLRHRHHLLSLRSVRCAPAALYARTGAITRRPRNRSIFDS